MKQIVFERKRERRRAPCYIVLCGRVAEADSVGLRSECCSSKRFSVLDHVVFLREKRVFGAFLGSLHEESLQVRSAKNILLIGGRTNLFGRVITTQYYLGKDCVTGPLIEMLWLARGLCYCFCF